jgi:hypothetical protein
VSEATRAESGGVRTENGFAVPARPAGLAAVVAGAVGPGRAKRFTDAGEMRDALRAVDPEEVKSRGRTRGRRRRGSASG